MQNNRLYSVDVMRGLTLFLMLFVNDLYMPGVPQWLGHTEASYDGMGLADWVFPGFLFMVGLAVPFAVSSRRKKGESDGAIARHVVLRTASLLFIGILILNVGQLNSELSGIDRSWWALAMYVAVFLIWNRYSQGGRWRYGVIALKVLGVAILTWLLVIFRAGEAGSERWLTTGWWGILGLIGWGYFVAALGYLLVGNRLWACMLLWLLFIALNIADQLGLLGFFDVLRPVLGVVIGGNVPSMVLAGLVCALLLHRYGGTPWWQVGIVAALGLACLAAGFLLREWFILSKIYGTPSWAMVCNGISMVVFALLFATADVFGYRRWANLFTLAGKNSLTTYLAPDVIYYLCWGFSIPLFIYKQAESPWLAIGGSLLWATAMIYFAYLLTRISIRLKL
ncbi:DUF5009 domain-containing protein [Parapedobacter sp. 2B3]|uniref:DUF5009 domain-containing protein n=1 Tax=Parapedobacter sp. 2B3 TaxID=3342381 RepID=UPI0035B5BB4A